MGKGTGSSFDESLDETLFEEVCEIDDSTKIIVSVKQYNGKAKKLQLSRQHKGENDDFIFAKLGRMTKDEITEVLGVLPRAIKKMA